MKRSHNGNYIEVIVEDVLIIDVVVSDNFEVVRVVLDGRFRHRRSKIQKTQLGIFFDNPHDFQRIVETLVHGCVCININLISYKDYKEEDNEEVEVIIKEINQPKAGSRTDTHQGFVDQTSPHPTHYE